MVISLPDGDAARLRSRVETAARDADRGYHAAAYAQLAATMRWLLASAEPGQCPEVAPVRAFRCVRDVGHEGDCTPDGAHFFWTPRETAPPVTH